MDAFQGQFLRMDLTIGFSLSWVSLLDGNVLLLYETPLFLYYTLILHIILLYLFRLCISIVSVKKKKK